MAITQPSPHRSTTTYLGTGITPYLRYNLSNLANGPLYFEVGLGLVKYRPPLPDGGTMWNLTQQFGLGYRQRMASFDFLASFLRFPSSNQGFQGREHNPGFNAYGASVGIKQRF